ncbi:hypothetical protein LG634_14235 [Streptomyces bambusae]|uniref:hypothetical protein n=1 Tax=Streptomyces bambusae TaxID=1550616 RepID=UPI001CFC9F64|nr:hypothetical protein [Streptomyces bambusae]MCB5165989.1 hypothetical protein [Streptomyces bambusae]
MSELARQAPRRSELEISAIPEVAALATELTTLFNALQIPQQQYAARVMLDKSTVSRFLNGRRVASQDFIDRLLGEVERHRRMIITGEARARIKTLRLAALRETDPASFQLENLREELDRSHRAIRILERQQEALELLLDQREAEAENTQREMVALRGLWVSEQQQNISERADLVTHNDRLKSERQKLHDEIQALKDQLSQVSDLKASAEERCCQLEERLLEAERALAKHLEEIGEQAFNLTPREVLDEITASERDGRQYDAARTLSLSAAHLSATDLPELWDLLREARRIQEAETLVRDSLRFRSAEFCAIITEALLTRGYSHRAMGGLLAAYKSPEELDFLYDRWKVGGPPYGVLRHAMRTWAYLAPHPLVLERLLKLASDGDTTLTVRMLQACGTRDTSDVFALSDLLLALGMEREFVTLSETWIYRIPAKDYPKARAQWLGYAEHSINSETLQRVFARRS